MKGKKYSLLAGCLLLAVMITSISLANTDHRGKSYDSHHWKAKPSSHWHIWERAYRALLAQVEDLQAKLTQCKEAPPEFTILNPRPSRPPIIAVPPTARLDSLVGKSIAVVANYNPTMAPLAEALLDVVGVEGKVYFISDLPVAAGQSPRPITLADPIINMSLSDFEKDPHVADAIIVGNGF